MFKASLKALHKKFGELKYFSTSSKLLEKLEVNGIRLNWRSVGNGDHVVLCLPGFLGTIETNWAPVWKKMNTAKFTLVSWDPPGYGKSRPPSREIFTKEFCLQTDAKLAGQLMSKLGYEKYSVLGWSNGGLTGAYLAAALPDQVHKLVMCNSPFRMSDRSAKVAQMLTYLDNWSPVQQRLLVRTYERKYLEKLLKDWEQLNILGAKDQAYFQVLKDELKKIIAPTLYIHGGKDILVLEEHARGFQDFIQDFRIQHLPNAPHDILEFLDDFVETSQGFLTGEFLQE